MDTISSYRGNRPTHHLQTAPITIHCAAASAQCNYIDIIAADYPLIISFHRYFYDVVMHYVDIIL